MFRVILIMVVTIAARCAFADHLLGPQEVSASAQLGSLTRETEFEDPGTGHQSMRTSSQYFTLALRYGLFAYHGLEVEPEIYWTAIENQTPAYSLHANVAYNFVNPFGDTGLRPVMPFLLAGYGIGNAAPFFHSFVGRTTNEWDVSVLNLGAGLKIFVSESAALRAEYRFQRYSYDDTIDGTTFDVTDSFQNVLFGLSVFFPPRPTHLPMSLDAGDEYPAGQKLISCPNCKTH